MNGFALIPKPQELVGLFPGEISFRVVNPHGAMIYDRDGSTPLGTGAIPYGAVIGGTPRGDGYIVEVAERPFTGWVHALDLEQLTSPPPAPVLASGEYDSEPTAVGYFTDFVGRGGGGHGGGGRGGGFGHGRGRFGFGGGWWGQGWWPYPFWEDEWYPWYDAGPAVWGDMPWWELQDDAPCPQFPYLGYCPPLGAFSGGDWTYWPGAPGWGRY